MFSLKLPVNIRPAGMHVCDPSGHNKMRRSRKRGLAPKGI